MVARSQTGSRVPERIQSGFMSSSSNTAPSAGQSDAETTHFGFSTVAETDKAGLVRQVFDSVAGRYDLMNDVMSAGVHRLWKASLIDSLRPRTGERLLDVAGGTGDIAFRAMAAARRAGDNRQPHRPDLRVTVCDINAEMLRVGAARAESRGYGDIDFVCGDAEALPFPDRSFDAYTIAFGIRNVTRIDAALEEAFRVLRPGGRFFCLEFSPAVVPALKAAYDRYSFSVIPRLGGWITGDRDSYRYLVESIRRFPAPERFAAMIGAAGFDRVKVRGMSMGVVALHSGVRL